MGFGARRCAPEPRSPRSRRSSRAAAATGRERRQWTAGSSAAESPTSTATPGPSQPAGASAAPGLQRAGVQGGGLEGLHRSGEERQFRAAAGLDRPVRGPGAGNPARRAQDRGQGRRRRLPRHPADRTAAAAGRGLRGRRRRNPTSWSAASRSTCRTAAGDGTIDPHVVFRVIQGYKYFGSYGITNVVGGHGGKSLRAAERGPRPERQGRLLLRGPDGAEGVRPGPEGGPGQGLRHPRPGGQIRQRGARNSPTSSGC